MILTQKLDKIASEIEKQDPLIAMYIDKISDTLDRLGESNLKKEMVEYLKNQFKGLMDINSSDFKFDVEAAIYWFASDYHGGQWSELYSILSTSDFKPGPTHRSIENSGEQAEELYKALETKYKNRTKSADQLSKEIIDPKKLKPEDLKNLKVNVITANIYPDRVVLAMMTEAGLKDEFMKLFEKGKNAWKTAWNSIKDKSLQVAIKGLKTLDQVKDFVVKHPELKFAVFAAIILGFLVLPSDAMAQVLDAPSVQDLAKDLQCTFHGGPFGYTLNVGIPKGWVNDVVSKSLQDGTISDLAKNIINVVKTKTQMMGVDPNASRIILDTATEAIMREIKSTPDLFKMLALA